MSGHYRMHRGWMDNPALGGKREPYCRRAAWCWLIERAAWKATRDTVAGKTVLLQRGQLTASLRFMATAWGWSEPAVRRFIDRLKTDAMIDAATDAGQMVITICNYSRYQANETSPDAATDAATDAEATQERRKEERREEGNKEIGGGSCAPVLDASPENAIVATFLRLRRELWPNESGFPAPTMTLATEARGYLEIGGTVPLICEVMERGMRTAAFEKRPATVSLKAFRVSIPNAIANHRNSLKTPTIPEVTNDNRHRGQRQQPQSFDDQIRDNRQAVLDAISGLDALRPPA